MCKESFFLFCSKSNQTGQQLIKKLLAALTEFGLYVNDCEGQGYDSDSNLRENKKGTEAQFLGINTTRFLFVSCGCHNLNFVLDNTAKC